jgi:hypothetical protein
MRLINHPRLWVDIPNVSWTRLFSREWRGELFGFWAGHGGDEYGNCSIYCGTALFSVVFFPGLCFQREVEVPDIWEHPWFDAMYYRGERDEAASEDTKRKS